MGAVEAIAVAAPVSLAEAKALLRIETSEEDALIAGFLRAATGMCERFTGLALIARAAEEVLPASRDWRRLGLTPVRAITNVTGVPAEGAEFALPVGDYAIDIDASGNGWVRVLQPWAAGRVRVAYAAGLAADWNGVPEPLRQGVARLAGHMFEHRDTRSDSYSGSEPRAAVTALWRPYRRIRLAPATRSGSA